jgi:DNA-binding transcriptional regulator LsrR (DeoR family)
MEKTKTKREFSEKIPKEVLKEWLYLKYIKDITDADISNELGVARVTITNYFRHLRAKKTIQIKITNYLKNK